ncbi:LOW QUALITY PROTEIN: cilia- and flagella-associated protein 54 [Pantherophis guttatus]|uniref:LOW QUALITY PROTEIN: cilia- and flagella-associated protein 54 n=1 Tax=Pantherophis guttatus TaxID=94885 RepID=A0A6P9AKE4_PANGU|nr:LOW QUALITY PROTEIN: cilia- and flagella-associated protein 54 [Pantherophis guttatus]
MAELPKRRARSPTLPPPAPAIFYGSVDPRNPVVHRFESDLSDCLGILKRKREAGAASSKDQELHRRGTTSLFNIWNNYRPLLPDWYYNETLVKIGDQLMEIKEHKLAFLYCYEQYLQQISGININKPGLDAHQLKSNFFPNGFRDQSATRTLHVLQARNICLYKIVCDKDSDLLNQDSVKTCFNILTVLQLVMQMTLPHEHLCWIVYNGTVHMYTICRHLMTIGQSAKVLEYLLWASVCMESSIPLLAVHYLTWRATLYSAVCQCYYDCQSGIHGEVFARRGLIKIDELKQMEFMSSSPLSIETKKKFKEATVKMAAMIFKRTVFEPRRRPKGVLRPRIKANLKEAQHLPWPRTITERLLMEIFDCNSSIFFAIMEALFDKNRRTLIPGPSVPDEIEVRDIISELCFAGADILEGGGINVAINTSEVSSIITTSSLMQQILAGKNGISADAALRFIKIVFSYEEWDSFEHAVVLFFSFLQNQSSPVWKKAEAEIKLLLLMQNLLTIRKARHGLSIQGDNIRETGAFRSPGKKYIGFLEGPVQPSKITDDLFLLAKSLYSSVCKSEEIHQPAREMIIDATMFLWQKCKVGIQKIQMSGSNFLKFIHKYQTPKWLHIIHVINEVIHTINLGITNPVLIAEVSLRLTSVMENIADFKSGDIPVLAEDDSLFSEYYISNISSLIQQPPQEQLFLAYEYIDRAIIAINRAHVLTVLPDGTSVLDNYCKKITEKQVMNKTLSSDNERSPIGNNFIMDLHIELIQAQHRIAVKLLNATQDTQSGDKSPKAKGLARNVSQLKCLTELEIMEKIKKNKLSKALYLMQKATLMLPVGLDCFSANQLLEEAFILIQKTEIEQNTLNATLLNHTISTKSKVPPPPILLFRTNCSMAFKPAPFASDVKVFWYSIFGCVAEGSNPKARLNNYSLKNTAEAIPADETCVLEVQGLEANQNYVFAVAAYDSNGKIIGDSIGETTKPILAYPPLSVAIVRTYLIQSAFQIENYALCKKTFQPLWDYFVSVPSTPVTDVTIVSVSSTLSVPKNRLNFEALPQASPNLLYMFLRSIFIISDISVNEGSLFCDSICFNELKYKKQVARVDECGRMLVAVELSNWLNDVHYALQSVVNCYGLVAPLIYHKIPSKALIQIIIKYLIVLQEIPTIVFQRKSTGCFDGIQHMIACSCFFTAKILRLWKEYELAIVIINYGKRLLDCSQAPSQVTITGEGADEILEEEIPSKRLRAGTVAKVSENLEVLENMLLRLIKAGQDLTGEEDPLFLYPVVSNWQPKTAYREVLKFKKNSRFLEYFVMLVFRALNEDKLLRIMEWSDDVQEYLKKRNRFLLGIKQVPKKRKKIRGSAETRRTTTQDVSKATELSTPKKRGSKKKSLPKQSIKSPGQVKTPGGKRKQIEEKRKFAFEILIIKLNICSDVYIRRRRFRRLYNEEMPWRAQLNIYLAIVHFNMFKKRTQELYSAENFVQSPDSYNDLNPEIFSLSNSGTIMIASEEENTDFKHLSFKRIFSEKISRKTDTPDLTSPAFDNGLSLPASSPTLQSISSGTVSSSSILDHNNCLSPEIDAMSESIELTQLSTSGQDSEPTISPDRSSKLSDRDTPRLPQGYSSVKEREKASCYSAVLEHFTKTFLYFRRAVVIAHRGRHWTLLQNACRDLWNYTREIQMIIKHSGSFHAPFPVNKEIFLKTIWLPYYMASDTLLDLIVELQDSNYVKIIEPKGNFGVPSCIGGITIDEGGSNLSFEHPLDDVNIIDFQGIRHFILQTLEFLFRLKKWESLVYIAMQFNTITHERYTEQVTPVLVFAQRQLQEKKQLCESDNAQSCLEEFITNTGDKVCCRNFVAKKLYAATKWKGPTVEHFDHLGVSQTRPLFSVPLDPMDTLKCFRETLEKSKNHSRALKYSRKLLSLFLAHVRDSSGRLNTEIYANQKISRGKVGFTMGAELTYEPEPPDLSEESFTCLSMVESNSIPQSKVSVVISSYEQTIETLQTNNQHGLMVQAFHELGNLHFFTGSKRIAFKCWCQGLDEALKMDDALHQWQELDDSSEKTTGNLSKTSQVYSEKFISRVGIWGCLQGATLAAKIAQHSLQYNIKLRTKTCILSAILFKSLFRASLPHPKADCDFAQYETDILIPGIDLFVDYYRADIATVIANLSFVLHELHCRRQNLIILPLFTLYQYFVSEICRNEIKCFEGRILKIKVLTDLGFFSDAFHELCIINRGDKIPWKLPSVYKRTSKVWVCPTFDSSHTLLTSGNVQVLEEVFNKPIHSTWTVACEPKIMDNFMLAKMHFIISISATLYCVPEKVMRTAYCTDSDTLKKSGRISDALMKGYVLPPAFTSGKRESVMIVELERNRDTLNASILKGILLAEAEERINLILETIQSKYGAQIYKCSAVELEIVIEAKLQLAAIAQQRLQTAFSAALVFSTIKLLQDAEVFTDRPNSQKDADKGYDGRISTEGSNLIHNVTAREHLNIHIWLKCRLALVIAITAQARGIEVMKENELTECSSLINEVQMEAEAFNDVETLAEITMQAIILGLQERLPVADIKLHLQNVIKLLEEKTLISPPANLLLVQSMLLLADIMRTETEDGSESSKTDQLNVLVQAHALVIKQLFILGQSLEQHGEDPTLTTLKMPMMNIYLPHIALLAKVKMRIGHTLTLELSCKSKPQSELQWLKALQYTETALNLSVASVKEDLDLEAELLFRKGRIERQLDSLGLNKSELAVDSLLDAINFSLLSYQHYGLIRRSYMEIALLYFYLCTNKEESPTSGTVKGRTFKQRFNNRLSTTSEEITVLEIYRVQAWIAVRSAAQVSEAILTCQQLTGRKAIKLYHMRQRVQQIMPEFALLDLSSSYKDFLSGKYEVTYKIPMVSSVQETKSECDGVERVASKEGQGRLEIPWLHVLRYHTYLTRFLNLSPLAAVPKAGKGLFVKEDVLYTSVFDTTIALRLAKLHSFLKSHLPIYSGCCLQEPPKQLYDLEKPFFSLTAIGKGTLGSYGSSQKTPSMKNTFTSEIDMHSENKATCTPMKELCVQWYLPSLEKSANEEETLVLFIFAYNTKAVRIININSFNSANIYCGYLWIPLNRVIAVREKLADLKQQVEMLIQSQMTEHTEQIEIQKSLPSKGLGTHTGKVLLDENTKEMVKVCFSEIKALLSISTDHSAPLTEIPFEITLPSIKNLSKLFDPANGCVIMAGNVFSWILSLLT